MKSFTAIAALCVLAVSFSPSQVDASANFVSLFPNGDVLGARIGHADDTGTPDNLNKFGMHLQKTLKGKAPKWSKKLCKSKYPGSKHTVGEVLGDPCCVWKKGAEAAHAVTAESFLKKKPAKCKKLLRA